ncbi:MULTISPECIES: bacteriocin immunity protein [Companilactobacillus]|uniref:bacteriocin immunity protein n=1 Tax=Companilactobacillus TaxID=2767879 RepID=UPI0006CFE810|nr:MULTISPECIES: bacteriocin immunity protein [Companilactobacillus]KAE9557465.1 Gar-IM [Companilactobacillus kimchii]KAE9560751.1 Gar-IM [Companilactobacillus bobalius]KAE9564004.1 Gar-IM [Companilactobacillus bobalius]
MMPDKNEKEEEILLSELYDFVLNPNISDDERKIGLMAKADLEKGRYTVAVLNQIIVSFQQLDLKNKGLTPDASHFYDVVNPILIKMKPIGTNLGYIGFNSSYLS